MSGHQKCEECTHGQELLVCSETQGQDVAQESKAVEEPSASSPHPLISSNMKEAAVPEIPSTPEGLQISCFSSISIPATSLSQSNEGFSSEEENSPTTSTIEQESEHVPRSALDEKVASLVKFMLLKYQVKETFTNNDVLQLVNAEDQGHFSEIFLRATERLEVIFGLEMQEEDPFIHSYHLSIMLGLTYDGMENDEDGVPKSGILILMLSLIFMKGNRATENEVWDVLNVTGIHCDENHFIFGDPKLIFHEFVKEKYLEYQPVANSDPVQYEFLWGPRAHAETSKMKVLEFMAKMHGISPSDFPDKYEEALLDEEERALSRNSVHSGSGPMAIALSSAMDDSFSQDQ